MLSLLLWLLIGFILLIVGGELLVRGAVQLAERAGMSQLLIGLTIVGFGTSAPELVASLEAAFAGSPGIAWGNIVGSNLANGLLILGIAALIMPMPVERGPLWRDGGLALVITAILYYCAYAGLVGVPMGAAFLVIMVGYLVYAYISEGRSEKLARANGNVLNNDTENLGAENLGAANLGQQDKNSGKSTISDKAAALEISDSHLHDQQHWSRSIAILIAGMVLIIMGGKWLVSSAVDIAEILGISETIIGLTVIAIGTSLPELVTSVIAARKGASAVALGNVLGSNLFNLLFIGGVTAVLAPAPIPDDLIAFGLPMLLAASLLLLIFAATKNAISRAEGAILLILYLALIIYNIATI